MNIFSKICKKETKKRQIGLAENAEYYCVVYQNSDQIIADWHIKPFNVQAWLTQTLPFDEVATFIRPIPFSYIWRKYLFFPLNLDKNVLYRQLLHILRQELPLNLEEIYFDYQIFPLTDDRLQKVIVYAVRKHYADSLICMPNTILDCELLCFA
ncbi:hypothetical protein A6046_04890 [[Haemophilus] ducreyi]|uniref:Competence protein A-like protein n=1 Tax=Haemophilus ducreyi (strain 35000HP / ATCC 700724) TaxID=233412 RepID=Q7VNR0_HAEDU|nr:hypothetical protein [[Haemophilus] ducreyi]AAP95392.1 putative competence protein A-like protein [[Haemophilus] ducreyi 35000HP]ANF59816.1 hypothetical protein A6036_00135 [[Haemophilus] ducreyi]ANF63134.1 hypothetical protein A6038_02770 [[Haemophilus] ducreyi]ANF65254.1 hypothetical protein A6039_06630 [[Haemophilus] ducreyi]ANF66132.1 hypothetical protein A6040_03085 [[Haemophilus] ducreyi]